MGRGRATAQPVSIQAPAAARQQLAATVAALRSPASYPSGARQVQAIETHMSWVFLTDAHAYKLKKPFRTPWFDYTTAENRKRACETELALNRRLASDVYLAVVPFVRSPSACVEQPGIACDWLVKMRRLPAERMLDARIIRGTLQQEDVDTLARLLSSFYATTARAPLDGLIYRERIRAELARQWTSLEQPHYGLSITALHAVREWQEGWLPQHAGLLEARAASVVEAHGDLRPEHICLAKHAPAVIDCLEFDRSLRLLDPVSELSFLALECGRLNAAWVGQRLLEDYARLSRERLDPELVRFYQSYHALMRAAIAVWHLDDRVLDGSERWRRRGNQYLELALPPV